MPTTFATVVDEHVLAAIRSDTANCERDATGQKKDPTCYSYMPPAGSPNGKPWSERKDDLNDPVTRLAGLLDLWIKKGRPTDAFVIGAALQVRRIRREAGAALARSTAA